MEGDDNSEVFSRLILPAWKARFRFPGTSDLDAKACLPLVGALRARGLSGDDLVREFIKAASADAMRYLAGPRMDLPTLSPPASRRSRGFHSGGPDRSSGARL